LETFLQRSKEKTMSAERKGFTLIELMVVVAVIGIVASIALPNFLRARISANEAAAIQSLRTLVSAEDSFRNTAGLGRFATLNELSTAIPPCIDNALGAGKVSGYTVTMVGVPGPDTWAATAIPNVVGTTGNRGFFVDQSGVIRFTADGTAPTIASQEINK
jgi:type IV pilus assembly protein PilA